MSKLLLQTLIVGMNFRPPAQAILAHMATGAPLWIVPEPENAYDEHALKVYCRPSVCIPVAVHAYLEEALAAYGHGLEETLSPQNEVFLGYVAKTGGKPLAGTGYPGSLEFGEVLRTSGDLCHCRLGVDPLGKGYIIALCEGAEPGEADAEGAEG